MSIVSFTSLLDNALRQGYAVGYFEAWDSYSLEAVLEAAEAERSPVILGFGGMMLESTWLDCGGVKLLGALARNVGERAQVPVSLLLNEVHTLDQARAGVQVGFNAVMLDTSDWPWPLAVEAVTQLVGLAHAHGVAVEAELGRLPDAVAEGVDRSRAALTDPQQARQFIEQTGADCLAVSIGNVHLLTNGYAPVDMTHLEAIHQQLSVPFVIHGGTSFPPSEVPRAIAAGVAKFNVGTLLKRAFLQGMRETIGAWPGNVNVHDVMGSHKATDLMTLGQERMKTKVRELMRLYGSTGRAYE